MTNDEKALFYDDCIRENDRLLREISRIKSEYMGNIPPDLQEQIRRNEARIGQLVAQIENLMR